MTTSNVSGWLDVLAGSHDRLTDLVSELDEGTLGRQSYCDDWTIAQVLSHIGSGGEIVARYVDAVVAGDPPPSPSSFPQVWARWNAMAPREVRDTALATDGEFVEKLERLGDALDELEFTLFGVMRTDAVGLIWVRLNEHALHTWDIAVALAADARVDPEAVNLLVDRLPKSVERLGNPGHATVPRPFSVHVVTTLPDRGFRVDVSDAITMTPTEEEPPPAGEPLHIPAEAFLRLLYGRLDESHSPKVDPEELPALAALRSVFSGV